MSSSSQLPVRDDNHLSCFPYGVGHSQEGVCLLVDIGGYRLLLDCGLEDMRPLLSSKQPPVDFVFCSHAHRDHARGLLALHQAFPQIPIYCSEVTAQLLPLNWSEVEKLTKIPWCQTLPWRSPKEIEQNLTIELLAAGHLPGAACLLVSYRTGRRTYKLLYTGDFCLSNLQLVEGLAIEPLRGIAPDVLIIEGSYGTARHPHRRQQEKHLMERIKTVLDQGRGLLLPVPKMGIGQEILKLLRSHHQFTGRDLDIWVDPKIALACDRYLAILDTLPIAVQNFAKHQALFWDERVCPRLKPLPQSLKDLGSQPCIVMVELGEDLKTFCGGNSYPWSIFLPELTYLDEYSYLEQFPNCQLETYLLTDHSDIRNTVQLIHNLRPQHIIFIHGTPTYLGDITSLEELQNRYQLHSPNPGSLVELPVGDTFIQPQVTPKTYYEGELNETGSFVTITIPDAICSDPRWNNFVDTGLVEVRFSGEELIIRGISQRELLQQNIEARRRTDLDCCRNCRHFRSQRCWNETSPLYGFKVTPEGYCPVFESLEP